jgi:PAS domain S-box-containing protein
MSRIPDRLVEGSVRSRALIQALVDSVADGIFLVGPDGRTEFFNRAGLAALGYREADELIGRPGHETIHHSHRDGSPFPVEECPILRPRLTGETVRVDEDFLIRRDGSYLPVAYSSAPFPTARGRGAVVAFHDISQRRRAERIQRQRAAERARVQELEASRARIVAATDAERRRIGRDLHDGSQQRLVELLLCVGEAQRALPADSAAAAVLDRAAGLARTAIGELRELAAGLNPAILQHRGLRAAVESLTARSVVAVSFSVPPDRFPEPVEATAYFLIAEALANVAKHAATAEHVRIEVDPTGSGLRVSIADDGPGGADPAGGSGLIGLADRVAILAGTLRVDSPPGGGTRLEATLPLHPPGRELSGGAQVGEHRHHPPVL